MSDLVRNGLGWPGRSIAAHVSGQPPRRHHGPYAEPRQHPPGPRNRPKAESLLPTTQGRSVDEPNLLAQLLPFRLLKLRCRNGHALSQAKRHTHRRSCFLLELVTGVLSPRAKFWQGNYRKNGLGS